MGPIYFLFQQAGNDLSCLNNSENLLVITARADTSKYEDFRAYILTKFTLTVREGLYSFTIPALFTKTSMRPKDSIHSFTAPVRNKGKSQDVHRNTSRLYEL